MFPLNLSADTLVPFLILPHNTEQKFTILQLKNFKKTKKKIFQGFLEGILYKGCPKTLQMFAIQTRNAIYRTYRVPSCVE